jgi:hypothetical protein
VHKQDFHAGHGIKAAMTEKLPEGNGFVASRRAEGPSVRGRRTLGAANASYYNDNMLLLGLLLSLAAPSRAQVAPAPAPQVEPGTVDEIFKRFASGKPMIPTLKEVQAEQLKRDLAPRKDDGSGASSTPGVSEFGHFNQPPMQGVRRDTTESVDVAVSRPLRRIELGAGYAQEDVYRGTKHLMGDTRGYGFVRLDLSKVPLARKLLHSPTAVHSEILVQDDKTQVSKDEYTTRFLTHPSGN